MGKRNTSVNGKALESATLNQLVHAFKRSSLKRRRPQLCISIISFDAANEQPELVERPRICRRSESGEIAVKFRPRKLNIDACKPELSLELPPEPAMTQAQSA